MEVGRGKGRFSRRNRAEFRLELKYGGIKNKTKKDGRIQVKERRKDIPGRRLR